MFQPVFATAVGRCVQPALRMRSAEGRLALPPPPGPALTPDHVLTLATITTSRLIITIYRRQLNFKIMAKTTLFLYLYYNLQGLQNILSGGRLNTIYNLQKLLVLHNNSLSSQYHLVYVYPSCRHFLSAQPRCGGYPGPTYLCP